MQAQVNVVVLENENTRSSGVSGVVVCDSDDEINHVLVIVKKSTNKKKENPCFID